METLVLWVLTTVAILATLLLLPGVRAGFYSALVAALFLSLMNALLRPALPFLISPMTLLTIGTFVFFVNAGLVLLSRAWVPGFRMHGTGSIAAFSIVLTILSVTAFTFAP